MSDDLSKDKDVVMAAVGVAGVALMYAAEELRRDKDVVLLALQHPSHGESSFSFAAKELRADKGFVLQAVGIDGSALQFASDDLRNDVDVVFAAVCQNGLALEYASDRLRQTARIVEAAVRKSPQAMKWALAGLNQDFHMLQVAGFFVDARKDCAVEATLSVRFSFAASATTYASDVPLVLRFHEYMKKFLIYNPNLFCKRSCDPDFTNFDWPCRGTIDTCKGVDKNGKRLTFLDSSGKPSDQSCWRFSFRYHLSRCKATGGFMLQVEEFDGNDQSATEYRLGAGQRIETEMAGLEGLKIFRIRQGTHCYSHSHSDERRSFDEQDADDVARAVMAWYDSGCIEKRLEWIVLRRTGPNGNVLTDGTPTVVTFADGKPGMDLSYGMIDYSPIGFQPAGTVVVWP